MLLSFFFTLLPFFWPLYLSPSLIKLHRYYFLHCAVASHTTTLKSLWILTLIKWNHPHASLVFCSAHKAVKPQPIPILTPSFPFSLTLPECKLSRSGPPATIVAIDEESPNGKVFPFLFLLLCNPQHDPLEVFLKIVITLYRLLNKHCQVILTFFSRRWLAWHVTCTH